MALLGRSADKWAVLEARAGSVALPMSKGPKLALHDKPCVVKKK